MLGLLDDGHVLQQVRVGRGDGEGRQRRLALQHGDVAVDQRLVRHDLGELAQQRLQVALHLHRARRRHSLNGVNFCSNFNKFVDFLATGPIFFLRGGGGVRFETSLWKSKGKKEGGRANP